MRRLIAFACEGDSLLGTLDAAEGTTGLLIVSGGNEVRGGAHRGMALLAARLAAQGVPVFRYDRRGMGDSEGINQGYDSSGPDIAAAVTTFRTEQPQLARIVGFGNCDAATALVLFGQAAGVDALVLANPWVIEESGDLPPAAAIRARYAAKLRNPREWWRLLRGGVDLGKLFKGLWKVSRPAPQASTLATRFAATLSGPATIVLANGDNTAIAFDAALKGHPALAACQIERIATASHSFARAGNAEALEAILLRCCTDLEN